MIVVVCPDCKTELIEPDPPELTLTQEEKIQFRKDWDARVERSLR